MRRKRGRLPDATEAGATLGRPTLHSFFGRAAGIFYMVCSLFLRAAGSVEAGTPGFSRPPGRMATDPLPFSWRARYKGPQ